jgi:hypothetical protein
MDGGTEEDHSPAEGDDPAEEGVDRESVLAMAAKLNRAAEDLKEELSIDEAAFRLLAPQAHRSSRDHFVFEALDEIQKAVVSTGSWLLSVTCCVSTGPRAGTSPIRSARSPRRSRGSRPTASSRRSPGTGAGPPPSSCPGCGRGW